MRIVPRAVERVIEELSRLPGVGPRTAERLAFHLLKTDSAKATALGQSLSDLHQGVRSCQVCHNFAEDAKCAICASPNRDQSLLAVVEEPFDVVALEKTGHFKGLYHVLGGVISPIDGVGPAQLEIASLMSRLTDGSVAEVILATNPSTEGETTAMYIRQQIGDSPIKFSRLARGLPVGGDLEYADQITLGRALEGRQSF